MHTPIRTAANAPAAALLLVAGCAVWVTFRVATGVQLEDAWITYRYAVNLATGQGFVFNPGEYVLGTTTPLLTLALGLLGRLFGPANISVLSTTLMIAAGVAAALITFRLIQRLGFGAGPALVTLAVFVFHPDMLWLSGGGMETPLVLLLMAWSALSLARENSISAAVAVGLLLLTRIDGVVWAGLVLLTIGIRSSRRLWKAVGVVALIVVPWLLFATWYFGSPVPHSVTAKQIVGAAADPWSLAHLAERITWSVPYFGWAVRFAPIAGCLVFALGAWELGVRSASPVGRLLVVFPFAFWLALFVGKAPLYFEWYLIPVGYCALLVGIAVFFLVRAVLKQVEAYENRIQRLVESVSSSLGDRP